jgi:hypothetical protein
MTTSGRFSMTALIALVLAAVLVRVPVFTIGSVQPNLVLVVLITSSFFTGNGAFFALLVALGTILARATPQIFDPFAIGIALAAGISFIIKKHAVWPNRLGVIILIALGSFITYLVVAPVFVIAHPFAFLFEVFANIILSVILFEIFTFIAGRRHE